MQSQEVDDTKHILYKKQLALYTNNVKSFGYVLAYLNILRGTSTPTDEHKLLLADVNFYDEQNTHRDIMDAFAYSLGMSPFFFDDEKSPTPARVLATSKFYKAYVNPKAFSSYDSTIHSLPSESCPKLAPVVIPPVPKIKPPGRRPR